MPDRRCADDGFKRDGSTGNAYPAPPGGTAYLCYRPWRHLDVRPAMTAGAGDFPTKPPRGDEMPQCGERALGGSAEQRKRSSERNGVRRLLGLLTAGGFGV